MLGNWIVFVFGGIYGMLVLWWFMGVYWDWFLGMFIVMKVECWILVRVLIISGMVVMFFFLVVLIGINGGEMVLLIGFMLMLGGLKWYD